MTTIRQYQSQMNNYIDEILNKVEKSSEEVILWKPSDEEWSVLQILCHVEEIIVYWIAEFGRVVKAEGKVEWGRGLQDEARLKAVQEAEHRVVSDVMNGIQKAKEYANEQLSQLKNEALLVKAPHRNPKFGMKSMDFLVKHFVTEHLNKHRNQIERNIEKYKLLVK
ncbi:DinB family protein [Bacillus arachidis]|uniref:DinB family protein n=1 Tax=Bacillus arachidis TaxID=2819290 RepID=A0ABS3P1J7_9BACI|nr:DinB family protein [Bacillus arachidis]MBO1626671.1 DinB family protein [Bacillus arachidis]